MRIGIEKLDKRMIVMNEGESTLVFSKQDLGVECVDGKLNIKSDQLLYTPVGCLYYLISEEPMYVIIAHIPKNIIDARDELFFLNFNRFDLDEKLQHIKEILFLELEEATDHDALEPLFLYIYSKFKMMLRSASVDYIHKYYSEPISIAYLAKLENYNVNYFYKWFRAKYKLSPTEYIRKFRINKTKELLLTTDYSVTSISMKVGFTQLSSFTRCFKENVGMSPLQYRKRYQ